MTAAAATARRGYEWIKELAIESGRLIPDLLALARQNDPFFAGCAASERDAKWFQAIWEKFGFGAGIHLRRIHYRIVSNKEPTFRPNGKPYQNTLECWEYLQTASKPARYLRLVDAADLVDQRNPDPILFATSRNPAEPAFSIDEPAWSLPWISIKLRSDLNLPTPMVEGYDYDLADQRYHLAIWIEKSTMGDVLRPLCARFGVDLVTGMGFQSITSVISLLRERVNVHAKPTRIFYITDFDPAGQHMPVATARQIEFWRATYAPDTEIKLIPLALTHDQVIEYRLPRTPIKESDARRKGFEERYGEGAVELDALEAVHPGELARIVTAALAPYFDETLRKRLLSAEDDAQGNVETAWQEAVEAEAAELADIREAAASLARKYKPRAEKLSRDFQRDMAPLALRLDGVRHAVQEKAAQFETALPVRPDAAEADVDESNWLFDTSRGYLDQLECYRRYKGTSKAEMNGEEPNA